MLRFDECSKAKEIADIKIDQVWLIDKDDFMAYLEQVVHTTVAIWSPITFCLSLFTFVNT